jgi:hypothetical protein
MQVPPGESMLAGSHDWALWFTAAALILGVAALLSIWLGRHHSRKAKWLWTVIVVVLPILGGAGWFLLGHQRTHNRARSPREL